MLIYYTTSVDFWNYKELIPKDTKLSLRFLYHPKNSQTYWSNETILTNFTESEIQDLLRKGLIESSVKLHKWKLDPKELDNLIQNSKKIETPSKNPEIPENPSELLEVQLTDSQTASWIISDKLTKINSIEGNLLKVSDGIGVEKNLLLNTISKISTSQQAFNWIIQRGLRPQTLFTKDDITYKIAWIHPTDLHIIDTDGTVHPFWDIHLMKPMGVLLDKTWFTPPFRLGKKNSLVILDSTGMEVQQFRNQEVCNICLTNLNKL
jgi:hypothetical protein